MHDSVVSRIFNTNWDNNKMTEDNFYTSLVPDQIFYILRIINISLKPLKKPVLNIFVPG